MPSAARCAVVACVRRPRANSSKARTVYTIIAVATAHRYWEYAQAQQGVQYIFFTKDLSILGGLLVLFVTGAGRYSVDAKLAGKA